MHSWRFLLAFVAILQPISSFTERSFVNGRQECCDRQPPPLLERNKQTLDGTRTDGRELSRNRILNSREDIRDTRRYTVQQRDQLIRTSVEDLRNREKPTSRQSTDSARIQRIGSIERHAVRDTTARDFKNRRNAERDNSNLRATRHIISDSLRRYEPNYVRDSRIVGLSQNNVRRERSIFGRVFRDIDNQRYSSVIRTEVGRERRDLSERENDIRVRDEPDARDNRRVLTERRNTERNVPPPSEHRRSDDINSERHVRSYITRDDKYEERRAVERRMIDSRRTRETDELRLAGNRRDIRRYNRDERAVDREMEEARRVEYSRRVNRDANEFRNSLEAIRRDIDGNRRSRDSSMRRQIRNADEETRPRFIPTRILNREERNEIKNRGIQFRRVDTADRRSHSEGRSDYRDSRRDIRQKTTEMIPVRETSRHRMATRTSQNDNSNVAPDTRFRVMSRVEKEKPIVNDMFMNWQTVLYTLQGIYLCGIFIQMFYDNGKEQQKSKNVRWWTTATKLIKTE